MFNLKKTLLKRAAIDSDTREQDEHERVQVATCAILLEVAKSDDEFSSIEKATIAAVFKKEFEISADATEELMEIAKRKRKESIDLWEFTHLINENYSTEEKKRWLNVQRLSEQAHICLSKRFLMSRLKRW